MAEIENLKIGNDGTLHIVGNEDIVANAWQAGKTYVKNKSYVIREHSLYVCNVTHTSVEPFDATKWTEITIGDAIGNNIGDLSTLTTSDKSSLVGAVNEVNANKPTNTNTNPLFKVKQTANITKTIAANSSATILGSEVNLAQSGYTPVAVLSFYQTGSTCVIQSFDYRILSGSGVFCTIRNVGSTSVNMTANFNILFARNDIVTG